MGAYSSYEGVPAFHQKTYPKQRPARFDDFLEAIRATVGTTELVSELSYQEFIDGDFLLGARTLTA